MPLRRKMKGKEKMVATKAYPKIRAMCWIDTKDST